MEAQADKNRTERSFEEGQLVYLKLQPYLQSSVVSRTHQKLSFRYYGPYKILQKVGKVAYRLDLPPDAKIHVVVHVSLLKQFVATADVVSQDLSIVLLDSAAKLEPAKVLATRNIRKGESVITQWLVQWTSMPASLPTWEEKSDVKHKFQKVPAWGQAGI